MEPINNTNDETVIQDEPIKAYSRVIPGRKKSNDPPPGNPKDAGKAEDKNTSVKAKATERRVAAGPTDAAIRESVKTFYGLMAMGTGMVDPDIGNAIGQCTEPTKWGPGAPEVWVDLARQYPVVRNAIASIGGAGVMGQLFAAHMPLILVLSAKFSPNTLFGNQTFPNEPVNTDPAPNFNPDNVPTAPDPVIAVNFPSGVPA